MTHRTNPKPQCLRNVLVHIQPSTVSAGFTMLELVIVLMIVSIVFAMALPGVLSTLRSRQVTNAMLSANGAILAARYKSMAKGIPYKIVFSSANSTYTVQACSNCSGTIYAPTGTFTYAADSLDPMTGVAIPFSSATAAKPAAGATLAADQTIYFRPGGAVDWVADGQISCSPSLTMTFTYQNVSKPMTVGCYGKITMPQ